MLFSKKHQWVTVEGETATVGISDYAQKQLNDIVFVELPEKGKVVEKDNHLLTIESVKSVSDVVSPVSGEVVAVNEELDDNPDMINQDCYEKGWLVKIKMKDKSEVDSLVNEKEYVKSVSDDETS